jgi:hypothetical protein
MRRRPSLFVLCTLTAVVAPLGIASAGDPGNYSGRFDFAVVSVQPVSATELFIRGRLSGKEAILGTFTGEVDYLVDTTAGTFVGSVTKTAADGDLLKQTLTGHFTATGSEGDFAIVVGTGRFDGAFGGGTFVNAWTDASKTAGVVTFDGSLSLARKGNYHADGSVLFANVQGATQRGGIAPYLAAGDSGLVGPHTQYGSILNVSGLLPVDPTTLIFFGEVGPNPFLPGNPKVHVIDTRHGQVHCTRTAVFTLRVINAQGDAVFSGDGVFTVVGGTGRYRNASGTFVTNFETRTVPAGSDQAIADYQQSGEILRH